MLGLSGLKGFFVARSLALLGDQMVLFLVPVLVYIDTRAVWLSGLVSFVQWAPRLVTMPFLGGWLDRYDLRRQAVAIDAGRAALAVAIVWSASVTTSMVALSLLSLLSGYAFLLLEKTVASNVPAPAIASTQGWLQSIESTARTGGPLLVAVLVADRASARALLVVAALFALASVLNAVTFTPASNAAPADRAGKRRFAPLVAYRVIRASGNLSSIIWTGFFINLIQAAIVTLMTPVIIGDFHRGTGSVATAMSIGAAVVLIFSALMSWLFRRVEPKRFIGIALVLFWGCALSLGLVRDYWAFVAVYCAQLAGFSYYVLYMRTERVRLIPKAEFGGTIGLISTLLLASVPLAALLVFACGAFVEPQALIVVASALGAGASFVAQLWPSKRLAPHVYTGDAQT